MVSPERKHLLASKAPHDETDLKIRADQIVFTSIVMLPALSGGMTVAFMAIALPELTFLSLSETALLTSILPLSAGVSVLVIGILMDKYGRKMLLIFSSVTAAIGFFFITAPSSVSALNVGQFFCGLGLGSMTIGPTVYITESIAPDDLKVRNSLTSWTLLAINIGMFVDYALGALLSYSDVAMIAAVFSTLSAIVLALFIPESPSWLQQKGKHEDAAKARKRITFQREPPTAVVTKDEVHYESFIAYMKKITRKDIHKPILITTLLFAFMQFAGVVVYSMHLVEILTVKYLPVNPYYLAVVAGLILILSQVMYIKLVPLTGMRRMALMATAGTGLSSFLLAISIYLNQSKHWYSYLIDCLHIFVVFLNTLFSGGLASASFTIMSELFPADGQGFSAITYLFNGLMLSAALVIYQYGLIYIHYFIYIIFAAVSFGNIGYIYYFVPETVGKTLQELSDGFLEP